MIDLYLLEELVALQKYGTLARAAEKLAVTQPTVTRGMQKLEAETGVQLFNREPNRITLNATGEFAAKTAAILLKSNQQYLQKVRQFDLTSKQITVNANAPGPLIILNALTLSNVIVPPRSQMIADNFEQLLLDQQYTCLLLNKPLATGQIKSIYLGTEDLFVHLNEFTPLASQKQVAFAQLRHLTFLVFYDIGVWRQIIQTKIPDAKFLYQTEP